MYFLLEDCDHQSRRSCAVSLPVTSLDHHLTTGLPPPQNWDWDMWFRTEDVALYRECVVPDVSRTYHFAYLGGHVYSYLQYQYYSDKSLNTLPDVELRNVSRSVRWPEVTVGQKLSVFEVKQESECK